MRPFLVGAVVGVAALALGCAAVVGHGPESTPKSVAHRPHHLAGAGDRSVVEPARASTARDEKCDPTATPLPRADVGLASQADPEGKPLTEDAAVRAARQIARPVQEAYDTGSKVPDQTSYPAAASRLTFATADRWMPGSSNTAFVAPTRCVWMVTVDAPFEPRSTPANGMDYSYDGYTVLFDAASGDYLGVSAGVDTPNLITGKNVGADN